MKKAKKKKKAKKRAAKAGPRTRKSKGSTTVTYGSY